MKPSALSNKVKKKYESFLQINQSHFDLKLCEVCCLKKCGNMPLCFLDSGHLQTTVYLLIISSISYGGFNEKVFIFLLSETQ